MAARNILICGNYGAGNFGDELILKGLLKVARQIPNIDIVVMTGNPEETQRFHDVKTTSFIPSSFLSWVKNLLNGRAFRALSAIWKSDVIVFGGGGLFNEREIQSMRIWSWQARAFRWFRKPVVMVGQSFGKFEKEKNKKIICRVCGSMQKIIVRDTTSKKNLEKLGVTHNIHILKDSALWLSNEDFSDNENIKNVEIQKQLREKYAVITARFWPGIDNDELAQKLRTTIKEITTQYQMPVHFLAMQKGNISDRDVYEKLGIESVLYVEPKSINELWNEVNDASLIVSMRLHGCILAALARIRVLALSYDGKVRSLLTDIGLADSIADINSSNLAWLNQLGKITQTPPNTLASTKADQHTFLKILTKTIKSI